MADVFISYAHEDGEFVERLRAALEAHEREVWSDRDIEPADRWRTSASEAIDRSDAVIFIVSVASLASEPCAVELAHAAQANKRLIAACIEEAAADVADKPPEIAELSWIMMRPKRDDFDAGVELVLRALDTDLDAVREHTRILVRARAWELGGRRASPLLRGDELRTAEDWLSQAPARGVHPTDLHRQFIRASRAFSTRRARTITAISTIVAAVSVALAIYALAERASAVHQAAIALSQSLAAEGANEPAYGTRVSALLSLQAYGRSPTVQARSAVVGAIEQPLLATRYAAVGEINGLASTPDGRLIAAGGVRGVAIWRAGGRQPITVIHARAQVNAVAFSSDGSLLAAALGNGKVVLYHVSGDAPAATFSGDGSGVNGVAFESAQAGGLSIGYVTNDGGVFVRGLTTGAGWHVNVGNDTLLGVAFSADGSQLVVGGAANDTSAGKLFTYTINGSQLAPPVTLGTGVQSVAFDPSGALVAAGDDDGNVYLVNPQSGAKSTIVVGAPVNAVRFDPTGARLATGDSAGSVRLWNAASRSQVGETMSAGSIVYGLTFTRGGSELDSGGLDGSVLSWQPAGQPPLERSAATSARSGGIDDVSIDRTGTLIATANRNGSLGIWDGRSLAELHQLAARGDNISAVAFAPSGDLLAVGLADGAVALLHAASARAASPSLLPAPRGAGVVEQLAFATGGRLAVGDGNGYVYVWALHPRHAHLVGRLRHGAGVTAVAFDPSGRSLAVAFVDGGIYLYSLTDLRAAPRVITVTEAIWSLAFDDGGAEILAGDGVGAVELFDTATGSSLGSLPPGGQPVFGLAVSTDGQTVATSDGGGRLRLWDLAARSQLGQPLFTGESTFSVAFSSAGNSLVTGDLDGALDRFSPLLWSRSAPAFRRDLCSRVGRDLSPAAWTQYGSGASYLPSC